MQIALVWFRRDLRLEDHTALYHALISGRKVVPLFIFDRNILDKLADRRDARVHFIFEQVLLLKQQLNALGSDFLIRVGTPEMVFEELLQKFQIKALYYNRDYESYTLQRDTIIAKRCIDLGIEVHHFKDHVLFEKNEIVKSDQSVYTVFTPYKNKVYETLGFLEGVHHPALKSWNCLPHYGQFFTMSPERSPTLHEVGFEVSRQMWPERKISFTKVRDYHLKRDIPLLDATTHLGIHLRFGTLSIRHLARNVFGVNSIYFNELLWRDFYSMILQAFPHVEHLCFKKEYNRLQWLDDEQSFVKWCEGKTGYPMVDAGMRQLNETGFMHNRLRMITASFLVKHLLIDWRWGEAYFAEKLLDFDLASNNGGWQWAAGCGTDAAPYFRIFSPDAQQKKFDPDKQFIQRWIPELDTPDYPQPIVEHTMARQRCIAMYKNGLISSKW